MAMSASDDDRPDKQEVRSRLGYPGRFWWLGMSALGMVVGSWGTWAKTEVFGTTLGSSSGLEHHGWLALIAGGAALAAAVLFARTSRQPRPPWPLVVCAASAVLGAAAATYDFLEIESSEEVLGGYQGSGWGLYLTWLASISLFLASAVCLSRDTSLQAFAAAFSAHHRLFSSALRWSGFVLLGADVVLLFALGQGLIDTGPETETLGQGFTGGLLITGAFFLILVALLAYWMPRLAGTLLMFVGLPLFIASASSYGWASECDPNCWVASDRQGDLSGLAASIANSDVLSLVLFLIPPLAGLVIFVAGFLRHRDRATTAAVRPLASPPATNA